MASDVPMFDDIPAFDDLPAASASPQRDAAVPAFDDIPAFDDLPDANSGRPAPETALGSAVREGAHAVVPGLAGLAGMGYGAGAGALVGGPVGAIVGGIVGGVAAGMGTSYVQEKALDAADLNDREQRAANEEAHPIASTVGGLAGGMVGMSPAASASKLAPMANQLIQRGAGAGFGGAMEAGMEVVQGEELDAKKIALNAAAGAVFPGVNKLGQKFTGAGERFVPGRPNRTANPAADQAHADVGDDLPEVAVGDSSLAMPPPSSSGVTTGNPQSAPQRSQRDYGKGKAPVTPEKDMLTQGDVAPDAAAALAEVQPKAEPAPQAEVTAPPEPQPAPAVAGNPNVQKPTLGLKPRAEAPPVEAAPEPVQRMPAEPVIDAGFPKPGEPVAVGENEATPVSPDVQREFNAAKAAMEKYAGKDNAASRLAQKRLDRATAAMQTPAEAPAKVHTPSSVQRETGLGYNKAADEADRRNAAAAAKVEAPAEKPMPEFKGETAANPTVTDGQLGAGNYKKARAMDFGKPLKLETAAGDVRRAKERGADGKPLWEHTSPYDYGYFNKTKARDGDHIDWLRPKEGDPAQGDKHFIVDQLDEKTGKFDEPKVMTYYKDEAAARDHYLRGFGDGKGEQRLGAITEIDRPGLVKYLNKHTTKAAQKPFGNMNESLASAVGEKKDVRERAVYKDLVAKRPEMAEALKNASDEQIAAAIEGKRVRKYGVGTGNSAGYPVEGVTNKDGSPVTANTKAKAAERSAAHKKMVDWFEKSKPTDAEGESKDQLMARLLRDAQDLNIEGWKPTHKPKEWLLAREAQNFLRKPTPGNEKKFRDAERLLRGGDESVEAYRDGNRTEADIARSRRSGDDAISGAEAKLAAADSRNTVEDDMIAAIDAKRGGKFDVPHEEAETMVAPEPVTAKQIQAEARKPKRKEIDVKDSALGSLDVSKLDAAGKRKAEAARIQAEMKAKAKAEPKKVTTEGEDAPTPASEGRRINVADAGDHQRLVAMLEAANKKNTQHDLTHLPEATVAKARGIRDLLGDFVGDERGSVDMGQIKQDLKRLMNYAMGNPNWEKTHHTTHRARKFSSIVDEYQDSLSTDLQKMRQEDTTAFLQNLQAMKKFPKVLQDENNLARIYDAREKDSAGIKLPQGQTGLHVDNLPNDLKQAYYDHLKPIFDQTDAYVQMIRAVDPDRIGADVSHHVARITKGDDSAHNMLQRDDDPTAPGQNNGIRTSSNFAKDRMYYAFEDATGKRHIIQPTDSGYLLWDKYKKQPIRDPNFQFKDGEVHMAGQNPLTMRQATSKEIGDNVRGPNGKPMRYYNNAAFSALVANTQLGAMARHLTELSRIMNSPEFKKFSSTNPASEREKGYRTTRLANLENKVWMEPHLAEVFDDFAGTPQSNYQKLNSLVTKSIFWLPVAHINNVGTHWFIGRGWDWASPKGYKSLILDGVQAFKSVVNQDAFQHQMRREGAGTIYGGVLTKDMVKQIAKGVQLDIERNPHKWGPIADTLDVNTRALGRAVYDNSAKVMWSVNDMFLAQRVMELMRKDGFTDFSGNVDTPEYRQSMRRAVIESERDIPNYRVPTRIGKDSAWGRKIQEIATDPRLTAFGRYHYGMYNSYANIVKDAVGKDATAGDRLDAIGKLMATVLLGAAVYPMLDAATKYITGNEDAKAARRGPITVPAHLKEAGEGKQDIASFMRGTVTIAPLAQGLINVLMNKDFRGKAIVEPGDMRKVFHDGNVKVAARVGVQAAENVAKTAFSPYSTFANAVQKDREEGSAAKSVGKALRDGVLDIKDPSDRAVRWNKAIEKNLHRDAISRYRKGGAGPAEGAVNKIIGYN